MLCFGCRFKHITHHVMAHLCARLSVAVVSDSSDANDRKRKTVKHHDTITVTTFVHARHELNMTTLWYVKWQFPLFCSQNGNGRHQMKQKVNETNVRVFGRAMRRSDFCANKICTSERKEKRRRKTEKNLHNQISRINFYRLCIWNVLFACILFVSRLFVVIW